MKFWATILELLDSSMTTPKMYGWFHILWLVITVASTVLLCKFCGKASEHVVHKIVSIITIVVIALEIYKQINYTFGVENGQITADYQWYAFPFQFCSTPMYAGLLFMLTKKGWFHKAMAAFLATYAIFAGVCVMLYPSTVFISTIGINIQTMVCHGSMIVVGVFLLYTGHVRVENKTILKSIPVFAAAVAIAAVLNEIANQVGLLETDEFNMFFISPYCDPSLPVYSLVQQVVPFPFCLVIYILAFSLAAYLMLLIAIMVKRIAYKASVKKAENVIFSDSSAEAEEVVH